MALPENYGFIILRHVSSVITNEYWKRCYTQIRTFYENPILIIDDGSNPDFLIEDLPLVQCEVLYNKEFRGAGEVLPYYYLHQRKPFEVAIVLHDSVFLHQPVTFELQEQESFRFLWSIPHHWDHDIRQPLEQILHGMPHAMYLLNRFCEQNWYGSFGSMSVIRWSLIDRMQQDHRIFDQLPMITTRGHRSAWERLIGVLAYEYLSSKGDTSLFKDIYHYMKVGSSYTEYGTGIYDHLPIVKVWTGR
jgi:hypothetical protein